MRVETVKVVSKEHPNGKIINKSDMKEGDKIFEAPKKKAKGGKK